MMEHIRLGDSAYSLRVPAVTRYFADPQYVDAFFETGALRMPPFAEFRRHKDEMLRDVNEGCPMLEVKGKVPTLLRSELAQDAYVLCASTLNGRAGATIFKTPHGIHIRDPVKFAAAIAHCLPPKSGGLMGPCNYTHNTIISVPSGPFDALRESKDFMADYEKAMRDLAPYQFDALFLKGDEHAAENEFRFVFFLHREALSEPLDIVCSDARQYCERLDVISSPSGNGDEREIQWLTKSFGPKT